MLYLVANIGYNSIISWQLARVCGKDHILSGRPSLAPAFFRNYTQGIISEF